MIQIAPNLQLPLDVATTASAIVGIRGTGKTNTATVIVEQLAAHGQRSIIIDPLDVWWGLKSSADGKEPGLPVVVFGGPHGDLPLNDDDGERIAEALATERVTAVLSLRHLRKGAQERFATAFAERLYHLKGKAENRDRVLIVIDEASAFIPQQVNAGIARMVGAIEDLVRRGRASGIGVLLIDQRAASVNKNVLTQCELLIAHRQTHNLDRTAIRTWVEGNDSTGLAAKELFGSLASIGQGDAIGEAWIWSPLYELFERIRVAKRATFDSSATPKAGDAAAVPQSMASPDLDALRQLLEHEDEEPEQDLKNLRYLKAQLAEARKEISRLKEQLIDAALVGRRKALQEILDFATDKLRSETREVSKADANPNTRPDLAPAQAVTMSGNVARPISLSDPRAQQALLPSPSGVVPLSPKEEAILDTLAELKGIGAHTVDRRILAALTDQSPKSSAYGEKLKTLRDLGLITTAGDIAITAEGMSQANPNPMPLKLADYQARWKGFIRKPSARRIVDRLIAVYPKAVEKNDLARLSGISPTSSSYGEALKDLRSFGLVIGSKEIAATNLLFPEGLR